MFDQHQTIRRVSLNWMVKGNLYMVNILIEVQKLITNKPTRNQIPKCRFNGRFFKIRIKIPCNPQDFLKFQPFIESNASKIDTSLSHVSDPCVPLASLSRCKLQLSTIYPLLSIFQNFSLSLPFHQTYRGHPQPNFHFHGCSQQPPSPMPPPPLVIHASVASPLLKCLSLFSRSPKPSHG